MRSPLTGILFAAEVSGDFGALLPLSVAVVVAHAFTVLVLDRSVLTEKVVRRGYHVTREYEIDPLEVLFVREVMRDPRTDQPAEHVAHADETLRTVVQRMASAQVTTLRVIDAASNLVGAIDLEDVLVARRRHVEEETRRERFAPLPRWIPIPRWVPLVGPRSPVDGQRDGRS
jgi:hypothetical protein